MPRAIRQKAAFDRSSLVAFLGVGAAIGFIAAITMGAIDAPSEQNVWAAPVSNDSVRIVSAVSPEASQQIR